jgi:cyclic pyranopterin phosphate synthase
MVDITSKPVSYRLAEASGFIHLNPQTVRLIADNQIKKGEVLLTAELAGVSAAKRTAYLIPLCHQLLLSKARVKTELRDDGVLAVSEMRCVGQTGVEMEALTAVSVALLTIYDMCKAVDKQMRIGDIVLLKKTKASS